MFFPGFTLSTIELPEGHIRLRQGGKGSAVLLLHGHPRTHTTWHRLAPLLAGRHRVVCADLPGFGGSYIPADAPDHRHSSKRAKAAVMVDMMRSLGHERFAVAGHDRGAYTAFRMALDHPGAVERLAVLDTVPILEALERCDARFASLWWHWFFFAQPDKPERAILADPDGWYRPDPVHMGEQNHLDQRAAIHDPAVVHGMIEDYRAGVAIDHVHDRADRDAGRSISCPTLCIWAERDDLPTLYGDVLSVWRPWAADLRGASLPSGHHLAEEVPERLAESLLGFFA